VSASASSRLRHDLKNQLGIILGFSELLLSELDPADARRADIQEISIAAQRAIELVAGLNAADEGAEGDRS
jgi:signal transduction histidine kinase